MNRYVDGDDDDNEFDRRMGYESIPFVPLPRRRPSEESSFDNSSTEQSYDDSDDSLDRRIRSRVSHEEQFPREGSTSYRERARDSSPFVRGRARRIANPEPGYISRQESWERVRGRSKSRPRHRPYPGRAQGSHGYGADAYYIEDISPPPGPVFLKNSPRPYLTLPHMPPFDMAGNPLNIAFNLVDEKEPDWGNIGMDSALIMPKTLSIETSRGFTDEAEVEKIILTENSRDDPGKAPNLRWIHLQQEKMSIKSLEDLIKQIRDLSNDDRIIALCLLRQVAERAEKPFVHGHYLNAIVLRGDSHSIGKSKVRQPDRHCTFISFPFFAFQVPQPIPQQQQSRFHFPPELLQTMHLLESTKLRDAEQAICKLKRPNRFGKSIHVPQVWSIVIGSDLLITYSTKSFANMQGENIKVQKFMSSDGTGPSVLRIRDPFDRLFFFPLDQCKTWFELEELVYTQCELGPRNIVKNEFDLFLKDQKTLNGAQWPIVVASEESPFIDIFIRFKEDSANHDSDPEGDYYLQSFRRPLVRRWNVVYPPIPRPSTRDGQHGRAAHRNLVRPQLRRGSTKDTRRQMSQSGRPVLYEDRRRFQNRNRVLVAGGTADGYHRRDGIVRAHKTSKKEKGKEHEPKKASQKDYEDLSTAKDARNGTVNHEVSIHTGSSEQQIVAEPDSYYSSAEQQRRLSYSRGNSMAMIPYEKQQALVRLEPPLSDFVPPQTRSRNENSYQLIRRPLPPPPQDSTFVEDPQNAMVRPRRFRESQRDDPSPEYSYANVRKRGTIGGRSRYEEGPFGDPPLRRDTYLSDDVQPGRRLPPYRRSRVRPAADRIVSNSATGHEIEPDIYTPKRKRDNVPAVNVNDDSNAAQMEESKSKSTPDKGKAKQGSSSLSDTWPRSFERPSNSQRERRSGSFKSSRLFPPTKPSVLPILMWPTGPVDVDEPQLNNVQRKDFVGQYDFRQPHKSSARGPPRTPNTKIGNDNDHREGDDLSLAEVLERVYNSLLTDKMAHNVKLFREMERASRTEAVFNIQNQPSPVPEKDKGVGSERKESKSAPRSEHEFAEGFLNAGPSNDPLHERKELLQYETKLHQFSNTANELLECFVPASYSHPVIGRYYGSVKKIIKIVEESQKHNSISQLYTHQGTVWIIEDIEAFESNENKHLRPLSLPLNTCSKCKEKFPYKNEIDASNHLLNEHFPLDRRPPLVDTMPWVKKHEALSDRRCCEEHMKILRKCGNHLNIIHKGIQEIRDGVCTFGVAHDPRYRLPKALVVAFSKLTLLLLYTSHVLEIVTEHSGSWTGPYWTTYDDLEVNDKIISLQDIGRDVEEAVDKGRFDLTLMIRTKDYTHSIKRYEAVGPQYILTMVLKNLQFGTECRDILEVYKEYIARLSFQVSQYPRRRLLRSLKYVEEEIDAISTIMSEQYNVQTNLLKVLDPQSFHNTTETRVSMFDLELDLVLQCRKKYWQETAQLSQLHEQVQRLLEDTKTSVEINDDDHGKAILVFTIVTLVFLPLSFVASFLGMNTVDIRNQTTNQSLFWIVALPVTASVVILALVVGYKYETMRDYVEKLMRQGTKE